MLYVTFLVMGMVKRVIVAMILQTKNSMFLVMWCFMSTYHFIHFLLILATLQGLASLVLILFPWILVISITLRLRNIGLILVLLQVKMSPWPPANLLWLLILLLLIILHMFISPLKHHIFFSGFYFASFAFFLTTIQSLSEPSSY